MLYALDPVATRVTAAPGRIGQCPGCGASLIPKCGELVAWHWAHRGHRDCDPWWEPECAWHLDWKRHFPAKMVEVPMGPHRADVRLRWGVIEFQHSAISAPEIRERETFYRRMVWVFDAAPFAERVDLRPLDVARTDFRGRRYDHTFRWYHPRCSHAACRCPLLWDLGDGTLVRVYWIAPRRTYVGGYGTLMSVDDFLARAMGGVAA